MVLVNIYTWLRCLIFLSQLAFPVLASMSTEERLACQTFPDAPDLAKCPEGTIFVSPTAASAHFRTIQKAFDYIAKMELNTAVTVLIGKGLYLTGVLVDHPAPVIVLGQITAQASDSGVLNNSVRIARKRALLKSDGYHNDATATLKISNSPDVKIYNVDIEQLQTVGIALAFAAFSSNVGLYGCIIAAWQDTLFVGPHANVYVHGCIIRGAVDYMYGWGVLWVESSVLASRALGAIVAWNGDLSKTSGAYISNSRIESSIDAKKGSYTPVGQVALARPWTKTARTVFLSCELSRVIIPTGFTPWRKSDLRLSSETFLAEYNSKGPGGSMSGRKVVQRQGGVDANHLSYILDEESAKQFNINAVFAPTGGTGFIDFDYKHTAAQTQKVPDMSPIAKSTSGTQTQRDAGGHVLSNGRSGLRRGSSRSHGRRKTHHRSHAHSMH
ncbi:BZ3500_MvSof-1268-A1-R1_Chr6-3g08901 [Microbotryum saponariae]|uniref:pectinesterase n=1 Tax=Microbotryum saponariae TaxID=289078 RepID=A0A2X0M625_9BASI|nr:BZ3500_MvSof-1268-A1-R1_Chr6-3g08901 [Microbotryum saponariae]SDA07503.1 BZ3501_MvSof-1269-A2-R1_Chr6-2g08605 [Microbotryum saponariae]